MTVENLFYVFIQPILYHRGASVQVGHEALNSDYLLIADYDYTASGRQH